MRGRDKLVRRSLYRKYWDLAPRVAFLNHGSFGACPRAILRLQSHLRAQMEAEPVQFLWRRYDDLLDNSRALVARFVGARPRDLVFVTNATTGVNSVVRSLPFRSGDEILTTSHDYNACRNVLIHAAQRMGARLVVADVPFPISSPEQVIEAIVSKATARTRLAVIDHVTSSTALIFPIGEILRTLQERSIDTLVDGAHAPGMLPLNLERLGAAYYTGNLHKWVCAPKGAAFLWVREDKQSQILPAVISHGNNTLRPGHTPFQDRFDWAGSFDATPWLAAGPAIACIRRMMPGGWSAVRKANHRLVLQARKLLCHQLSLGPPCPESMLGSMATLPLPNRLQDKPRAGKIDREQLRLYDRSGIEVPLFRFGNPERRYFRISAQIYNTLEEYAFLAEKLADSSL